MNFKELIQQGIPTDLPPAKSPNQQLSHAPKRKNILSDDEKLLELRHKNLEAAKQSFLENLKKFGFEIEPF